MRESNAVGVAPRDLREGRCLLERMVFSTLVEDEDEEEEEEGEEEEEEEEENGVEGVGIEEEADTDWGCLVEVEV